MNFNAIFLVSVECVCFGDRLFQHSIGIPIIKVHEKLVIRQLRIETNHKLPPNHFRHRYHNYLEIILFRRDYNSLSEAPPQGKQGAL
jgi:hypothetical protein